MNTIDRLPPHNIEAEQAVLGAILLDWKRACPIIAEHLGPSNAIPEMFYDLRHRELWLTFEKLYANGHPIDLITVSSVLEVSTIGGYTYLSKLMDMCPSASSVGWYCEELALCARRRALIAASTEAVANSFEATTEFKETLNNIGKRINDISRQAQPARKRDMKTLVLSAIDAIEQFHQQQGALDGIPTGFIDFDKLTRGLHPGEMTVIAARPSIGKTSLAMNIAEHIACDQQLPVGVFSLEMTAQSLVLRMLCCRARVNLRNLQEGFLAERDFPKITGAAGKLMNAPMTIDDRSGLTIFDVQATARLMHEQNQIKVIVIDYLQLMCGSRRKREMSRQEEIAEISSGCKSLAKELGIPVIVLSQLNRELDKENRRPRLSDLRESGAIEQDADVVAFLWRPRRTGADEDEDQDTHTEAVPINLLVAKQRNGPTGDVPLTFIKGYTRFESVAKVESGERVNTNYDTD